MRITKLLRQPEEFGHVQGLGIQGTVDTTQVVADGFAETDGFLDVTIVLALAIQEAGLHEALADGDDHVFGPDFRR